MMMHDATGGGASAGGNERVLTYLDADLAASLRRWARAEDRSVAAQIRVVLRAAIPGEHLHDA